MQAAQQQCGGTDTQAGRQLPVPVEAPTRRRAAAVRLGRALLLIPLLWTVAVPALAQAQPVDQYNVVITDEATGFLASCTQVRVYSIDPVENVRLTAEPVAQFPSTVYPTPGNPIVLQLAPGRYELVVCMSWLPAEVHYMFFTVVDGTMNVVDILNVELPVELITY